MGSSFRAQSPAHFFVLLFAPHESRFVNNVAISKAISVHTGKPESYIGTYEEC